MKNIELNQKDLDYLEIFFAKSHTRLDLYDQTALLGIYRRTVNKTHKIGTCGSCWKNLINTLKQNYNKQTK